MKTKIIFPSLLAAILLFSCGTSQKDCVKYIEKMREHLKSGGEKGHFLNMMIHVPSSYKPAEYEVPENASAEIKEQYAKAKVQQDELVAKLKAQNEELEKTRSGLTADLAANADNVSKIESASGGEDLKSATLEYLNTYKAFSENEYKQLVVLYSAGDQDQAKYDALQNKIAEGMDEQSNKYEAAEKAFGKKHNIRIGESAIQKSIKAAMKKMNENMKKH